MRRKVVVRGVYRHTCDNSMVVVEAVQPGPSVVKYHYVGEPYVHYYEHPAVFRKHFTEVTTSDAADNHVLQLH
jgi:hypothetical protein